MRSPADDKSSASAPAFSGRTDATRVCLSGRDREVLMTLDMAIQQGQRVLLLTGEVGTGKTILSRVLIEGLAGTGVRVGWLPSPDLEPGDFYATLSEGLPDHLAGGDDFLGAFRRFLGEVRDRGQWLLLVIDDAHALRPALVPELVRLLDADQLVNPGQTGVFKILLIGQSRLETTLQTPECLALAKLIGVRSTLRSLSASEVGEYVRDRLGTAGLDHASFTPEALHEVVALSGGKPRIINAICDGALRAAARSGAETVDGALVRGTSKVGAGEPARGLQQPLATGGERRAPPRTNVVRPVPSGLWSFVSFVGAAVLGVLLAFGVFVYLARALPSRTAAAPGVSKTAELPPRPETSGLEPTGTTSTRPSENGSPTAPSSRETTPRAKPAERAAAAVSPGTTMHRPHVPATVRSPSAPRLENETLESASTAPGLLPGTRATVKTRARTTKTDEPEPSAIIDWLVKEGPRRRDLRSGAEDALPPGAGLAPARR